jgi:hypothetical protein
VNRHDEYPIWNEQAVLRARPFHFVVRRIVAATPLTRKNTPATARSRPPLRIPLKHAGH